MPSFYRRNRHRLQGSESFAEWLRQADKWREEGTEGLWDAVTDVSAQVSDLRHDYDISEMTTRVALWGDPEAKIPSQFAILAAEIAQLARIFKWASIALTGIFVSVSAALILHFVFGLNP